MPGGVDQYLEHRRTSSSSAPSAQPGGRGEGDWSGEPGGALDPAPAPAGAPGEPARAKVGSAEERAARKTLARLEKQLERIAAREAELDTAIAAAGSDHLRLAELSAEYAALRAERDDAESAWLEAAELVE